MEPIIGIYKITNKINGKSYVGQSVNIHQRWTTEKNASQNPNRHEYNYPLSKAFRKYGFDNFVFEIIEYCTLEDDLNSKEKHWIEFYDTYFNGYNQTLGGDSAKGSSYKDKEVVIGIIYDLKNTDKTHREIAEKWNVSKDMVQHINTGKHWRHNAEYPLQRRCQNPKPSVKPACDVLQQLLTEKNGNLVAIGKYFGVSDSAVKKWIQSYNIQYEKKNSSTGICEKSVIATYNNCKSVPQTAAVYNTSVHYIQNILQKHSVDAIGRSVPKFVAMFSDNEKIMCFPSATQAIEYLKTLGIQNPSGSHIASVCKGKRKSAYGYQWKYINKNEV